MKALFDTAEVSIRRGDETRVITKGEQAQSGAPSATRQALPDPPPDELPKGLRGGTQLGLWPWLLLAAGTVGTVGWLLTRGP